MSSDTAENIQKACYSEYFCEQCDFYPIEPVHGHFECPQCRYKTKCCEGTASDEEQQ